jgi:hypothetical protein
MPRFLRVFLAAWVAGALVLAAPAVKAAAEEGLAYAVAAIEREFEQAYTELYAKRGEATFAADLAKLRQATSSKFEALAAKRRAASATDDMGLVYEAMLGPRVAPGGEASRELAKKLLAADPDTVSAWPIMLSLSRDVEATAWRDETAPVWTGLQKWAADFRADPSTHGETQRALDLLLAHLALVQGVPAQAARLAGGIVQAEKGSMSLREMARRVRGRASLRAAGIEAPPFRLSRGGADAGDVALADLRGRIVLLLFSFDDDEEKMLHAAAADLAHDLASDDLAVVIVPLTSAVTSFGSSVDEQSVEYGDASRKVADAYGVLDVSALFLLGPTGQILKSQGWDSLTASEDAVSLARTTLGAPLPDLLTSVAAERSWASFPAAWRRVLARKRGEYEQATWQAAQTAGPKAVYALLLAAASAGKKPAADVVPDASSVQGKIVAAFCAHRFGQGDDAWKKIAGQFQTKSDVDVMLDVVDAMLDLGLAGDDVRPAMEQAAMKARDWRVASTALRVLAFQDCDAAPPHGVVARGKDKVWQIRLATAEALRAYRHAEAVAPLIEMLGDERQRVRCQAAASLKSLTREDFGVSQKQWATWRRAQGQKLELPARELNAATMAKSEGHDYAVSTYFGAKVASDRVVLVLDKSETMYYGLFDTGVEEVRSFLEGAGPTMIFNVIEFSDTIRPFRKKLVPANASNVAAAVEYLAKDKPYGPTDTADALREALAVEDVDTIVYLSDGEPANRGTPLDPAGMLEMVAKLNRYQRITIHTLWMTQGRQFPLDGPRGKDKPPIDEKEASRRRFVREHAAEVTDTCKFLQALASANGGSFGVAFGDQYVPAADAPTRPSSDK